MKIPGLAELAQNVERIAHALESIAETLRQLRPRQER